MAHEGVAAATEANVGYRSHLRSEVRPFLPDRQTGLKILEVGCGDGSFIGPMCAANEVWGVEPFEAAGEVAKTQLFRVLTTTFNGAKADLPEKYFDLVICNDVIEHMTDHDAFLVEIQGFMAPGACLVGSVPNVRHYETLFNLLVLRDWDYKDFGILDRTHFRFFTQKSLRRSLEGAGFTVERLEGINKGIYFGWNRWGLSLSAFAYGLIALTAGKARDIQYLQTAFRGCVSPTAPHPLLK